MCEKAALIVHGVINSSRPPPTTQRNLQVNNQSYVVNPTLTSGQSEDRRSLAKLSTATQLSKFEESPEDNSWESVTSRKPSPKKAVLFLGNLKANIQEDELRSFIVQRAASTSVDLFIYDCRIFPKVDSSSARIVVNDKCSSLLKRRDFWPRPLYCRPWNFEKYATTSSDSEQGSYKGGEDEHGTAGIDNQETSAQTDESTARRVQTRSQQKWTKWQFHFWIYAACSVKWPKFNYFLLPKAFTFLEWRKLGLNPVSQMGSY